ncbi:MAG: lysine 5,6-aminomutase subunit alpha, partial [Chloroflexota bacterium]
MMPLIGPGEFQAELEALLERARTVASRLARVANGATSLGRERAILRLIGVTGLDREGRPLAAEVVDRYVDGQATRLAMGIGFPFAMALLEYDTTPQQLALDVAAGSVDLQLESALLAEPERYAAAADLLSRLAIAAVDRIDANRVARGELIDLLHDRPQPWIGATIHESSIEAAEREAGQLVRAGFDLARVEVPATRELAIRLGQLGQDVHWRPRGSDGGPETTPAGSQRGLSQLRQVLDRAAAERGAYVRLAIAPTALASPEGAIVAAFERADVLELGPMREMFVTGVDPERAMVDFAFAVRVARRAGVMVHIDAGPLMV